MTRYLVQFLTRYAVLIMLAVTVLLWTVLIARWGWWAVPLVSGAGLLSLGLLVWWERVARRWHRGKSLIWHLEGQGVCE